MNSGRLVGFRLTLLGIVVQGVEYFSDRSDVPTQALSSASAQIDGLETIFAEIV